MLHQPTAYSPGGLSMYNHHNQRNLNHTHNIMTSSHSVSSSSPQHQVGLVDGGLRMRGSGGGVMDMFRSLDSAVGAASDHPPPLPVSCMASMCARQDLYGRMSDLTPADRFPMQLQHSQLLGGGNGLDDAGVYSPHHHDIMHSHSDIPKISSPPCEPSLKHDLSPYSAYDLMSVNGLGHPSASRSHMGSLHGSGFPGGMSESMLDQLGGTPGSPNDHNPTLNLHHHQQHSSASHMVYYSNHPHQRPSSLSHPLGPPPPGLSSSSALQHCGPHSRVLHPSELLHNSSTPMMGPGGLHHPVSMGSISQQHPVDMLGADCDARELESFAEHFKQRRIKIGVTQADVGQALGKLKIPGVGSLSQSTICRFESLTLSHNNMVALKPILQAWLEEAEQTARENRLRNELFAGGPGAVGLLDKKRKRTSIAAPEKRSLEAYFSIQPRPSGEKIAQIADKLDLKKNVVRVWFCNQRQKQKRMKFSAATMQGSH